jgi:Tfp pilus assembly protein PilO
MQPVLQMVRQHLPVVVGIAALALVGYWAVKIRAIQRLRGEIRQVEVKLSQGQQAWKGSPPLSAKEREELQAAQQRLVKLLPKEKDVPAALQDISRVARDYNLANLALATVESAAAAGPPRPPGDGASQAVVVQPAPAAAPAAAGSPGPIDSFSIKLSFAGDYREIASFLEALQRIPRLITVQSLQLQRGVPLVVAEVVVNAYYLKGDLSARLK